MADGGYVGDTDSMSMAAREFKRRKLLQARSNYLDCRFASTDVEHERDIGLGALSGYRVLLSLAVATVVQQVRPGASPSPTPTNDVDPNSSVFLWGGMLHMLPEFYMAKQGSPPCPSASALELAASFPVDNGLLDPIRTTTSKNVLDGTDNYMCRWPPDLSGKWSRPQTLGPTANGNQRAAET
ncbi:hypothetical protein H257_05515 [Aphanomyces astaci]|uniref:Uncharacterized protein n=1 Tax=Aphanomyces astaci TaxID=112090 RepID=W4GQK5_APHAT|nr:hypothetical protein H257_05515 [Aphanomyces astaci]ETV81987.1 hypothetical protein H257_05515 [Aphanomyces astaci]|eukprot:XP_009828724.1 hypothetical protein H257_05515 [Aphanomyces astaci]